MDDMKTDHAFAIHRKTTELLDDLKQVCASVAVTIPGKLSRGFTLEREEVDNQHIIIYLLLKVDQQRILTMERACERIYSFKGVYKHTSSPV